MKYDFETIIDRHDRDALAIDELGNGFAPDKPKDGFDVIPMWIADMNFETVPTVSEAIRNRISHGAFGYFNLPVHRAKIILRPCRNGGIKCRR